jgi:hypothetical protein
MEYLVGSGILKKSQVDGSFDGSPARFVAEKGEVAQSGYATSDPYVLQTIPEWGKPVKFQLVHDTGYPNYGSLLSIRARDKGTLAPCLKKLMPIVQQSQVDLITKPDVQNRVIDLTLQLSEVYKSGNPYTRDSAQFALAQEKELRLTGDGSPPNGTIGDFDMARIQRLIQIVGPIFAGQKKPIKEGLKPEEVATNEFLNTKIAVNPN